MTLSIYFHSYSSFSALAVEKEILQNLITHSVAIPYSQYSYPHCLFPTKDSLHKRQCAEACLQASTHWLNSPLLTAEGSVLSVSNITLNPPST